MNFTINPIGAVHSKITDRNDMPLQGVPASIEIFNEFKAGLMGIEGDSHIYVICWLDKAERGPLLVRPRKINPNLNERGVFSMRSPTRPNPLSLTATRLVNVEENMLFVDPLDVIDGSPVIDIKPYSAVWDVIFWARDVHSSLIPANMEERDVLIEFLREAYNYHGERCPEIAVGVKIVFDAMKTLNCNIKNASMTIPGNINPHVADCLIGIIRGTPGNTRLSMCGTDGIKIVYGTRSIKYKLKEITSKDPFEILKMNSNELFTKFATKINGTL
ncbi:MAG TPA: tRNA (N6-threonylcarbamoyladenosine(37)-N6)-methyltransferase TrmO [Candidatus Acidoferrales bacterium]|nr:tRNA (N6-threonylcarbamoyladenosine(37)-N6)-methyltransferase TrmO [Candidatus Acidoferrales bacterium]